MNLLALETSTHHLSVALWLDGGCLERSAVIANGGSEHLLPWVRELIAEAGITLADLDGVAFGAGPGSFTGLRLACGVAQGLAFGLDLPVLGISTLEALALAARDLNADARHVFACLDARMNEVYCGLYRMKPGTGEDVGDAIAEIVRAPFVAAPEMVAEIVSSSLAGEDGEDREVERSASAVNWLGCGDGFTAYPDLLAGRLQAIIPVISPTARCVARLAAPRFARGEAHDAAAALPLYVRDKVALTTAERLARGGVR